MLKNIALLCLILTLNACVSVPQKAFNKGTQDIKTIEVLPMAYTEAQISYPHPGLNFGLIGGAIAVAELNAKGNKLQDQLQAADFDHYASFQKAFDAAMSARGYQLIWSDPVAAAKNDKAKRGAWLLRKGARPTDRADAQIDINLVFYGYAASGAGKSSPYRPTISLSAQLFDKSGKKVLFSDVVTYHNTAPALKKAISIEPDPAFAYQTFDDLEAAGAAVAEGLDAAIRDSAEAMAKQL
ncbi:hypothetical protein C7S18_17605 [Ahniella affigens]|uniref:Lipoprotein n=1 Tax=Ahniella affigens TaxID=2021234 RepID=A0A2P1PVK4_9GAMM|nr:hypothetical protein [Ahniella affigens]AVP98881.1 hypothetical protein C7S18_17605 [Ahniella affigens]